MLLMDVGKTRRKADLNGGSEEFILAHFKFEIFIRHPRETSRMQLNMQIWSSEEKRVY